MPLLHHTGALGDFLLCLPFLRALRRAFPQAEWTLVAQEGPARLVSRVFPFRRRGVPGLLECAALASGESDLEGLAALLDRHGGLFGFVRGAAAIEAAARRLRPSLPAALGEPLAQTTRLGRDIEETLAELIVKVEPPGGPTGRQPGKHFVSEGFSIACHELPPLDPGADPLGFLRERGRAEERGPVALIHVGASGREKMAPVQTLRAVAGGLESRGWRVGWIRGPVEAERGVELPPGPRLDAPGIVLLAHAIARAGLYIGNDTGPTHLAAALGVPVISVHGAPNPLWRPRGSRARMVAGAGGFPQAEEVLQAALDLARE